MSDDKRAGLVLRVDGANVFVPAALAATVTQVGKITRVAGAPEELLGIAMHEGHVVPVVAIGRARGGTMVVCSYLGERIGLVGGEVVEAGVTSADGAPIDLAAIYARIQEGGGASLRSARWGA